MGTYLFLLILSVVLGSISLMSLLALIALDDCCFAFTIKNRALFLIGEIVVLFLIGHTLLVQDMFSPLYCISTFSLIMILFPSAEMDLRTKLVYNVYFYASFLIQIFCFVSYSFSFPLGRYGYGLLIVCAVVIVLLSLIKAYARADMYFLLSCLLNFAITGADFVFKIYIMLLISSVIASVYNCYLYFIEKKKDKHYPFCSPILISYVLVSVCL